MKLRIRWKDRDDLPERLYPVTDWSVEAYTDDLLLERELDLHAVGTVICRHASGPAEADADLSAQIARKIHEGHRAGSKQIIEASGEEGSLLGLDPGPAYRGTIEWELIAETPVERQWLTDNTDSPRAKRRHPEAKADAMSAPEWLYHVTSYASLEPIAAHGLLPAGRSALSSTIPSDHLEGAIFLTEADGLNFWYQRAEEAMVHGSDDPREEGYTPVVLRTPFVQCEEDYLGSRDAGGAAAYRCEFELAADELEYFDGQGWRPIDEWEGLDTGQAWDEDDYFLAETPLLPEWRDLEENPEKLSPRASDLKRRLMR